MDCVMDISFKLGTLVGNRLFGTNRNLIEHQTYISMKSYSYISEKSHNLVL